MREVTTIGSHASSQGFIFQHDRRRPSSYGACHAALAASELSWVHCEESMAHKLSRFELTGLSRLGRHAGKTPVDVQDD